MTKSTRPLFNLEQFESRIAPAVGSLDMSFGVGGIARANVGFAGFDDARAVARQEDGKILIAGQSVGTGGGFSTDFAVARYNPDGSLDTTFGTGGKAVISFGEGGEGTGATAIALEPAALGGRIIVAGTAGDFPDLNFAAVRLNSDGSLDTTFDGDGRVMIDISGGSDDRASGVGVLSDGRIAIGGSTGSFSDRDFAAVLLNPNGSLDTSFAGDGKIAVDISGAGSNDESIGLVVQPDDLVVLAGTSGNDFAAIRLKTDGSLDSGFDTDGKVTVNVVSNVFVMDSPDEAFATGLQPDGKILIAGHTSTGIDSNGSTAVVRLNSNGALDATFNTDGKFVSDLSGGRDIPKGIAVQADGKIIVAGDEGRDFLVFLLTAAGALDATYGTGGKVLVDLVGNEVSDRAQGLVLQPDGFAVIVGTSGADFAAIRLDGDGKLDPGFDADGKVVTNLSDQSFDSTRGMALQADGKVIVVGTTEDGDNRNFGAVRFNADGTVDTTFGTGGRVVIDFGATGGSLDREDMANAVAIQDDGKIIIGGSTRSVNGNPIFAAVRLNPDGSLDTTFDTDGKVAVDLVDPGSADEVIAVLIQPDGKIVLIGEGPSNTGATNDEDFAAARLNPDGSLDTTFGTGGKVSVEVTANDQRDSPRAAALQADGKIVIVGQTFNGTFSIFDIAAVRLNPDGTLDTSFAGDGKLDFDVTGTNQRDNANAVVALPDGRIVIAGSTSDTTGSDIALIGLNADGTFDPSFDGDGKRLIDLGGSDSANAAVRQGDGKIVIVGSTSDGDESDTAVVRVNADGSFDTTFGTGGKSILSLGPTGDSGRAVALDADGRIVVAAAIDEADFVAARLLVTDTSSSEFGQFAVGRSAGSGAATLFNADQSVAFTVNAFPGFTGGVRTAVGDFNGDGVADLVVGTGPGGPTQVRIFDGKTQAELFSVAPFEVSFLGGVYVAAGDLNGDGRAELIVTPDEGGGPRIRIFDGSTFTPIADFFGIDDPNFRGGARAALADVSGDGVADLIVAAGFGGGPRVAVFDGTTIVGTSANPQRLFNDIFVFEPTLRNGVFITSGDFNGDGFADLAAGGGPDGGPRVLILSGADLLAGNLASPKVLGNFFAGDVDNRGGIRLAAKDLDGDNRADLVVGDGTGAGSRVTGYLGSTITAASTPPEAFAFDAFPGVNEGVFVG